MYEVAGRIIIYRIRSRVVTSASHRMKKKNKKEKKDLSETKLLETGGTWVICQGTLLSAAPGRQGGGENTELALKR